MRAILASAHECRRRWRIANPTPAESLLHWAALEAGLTLHADLSGGFEWTRYRADPSCWPFTLTDAVVEGRVLGYACDLLLPAHSLALEVHGGVHVLTAERDAVRSAALHAQGIAVLTLSNEQIYRGEAKQLLARLLEARYAA